MEPTSSSSDMATFSLKESDAPKPQTEAGRFAAGRGSSILEIATLGFSILNHSPLLFVQSLSVRFFTLEGEIWSSGKDTILFFGRSL